MAMPETMAAKMMKGESRAWRCSAEKFKAMVLSEAVRLIGMSGILVVTMSATKPKMGQAVDGATDASMSATAEWAIGRSAARVHVMTDLMGAKANMMSCMLTVAAFAALVLVSVEVASLPASLPESLPERMAASVGVSLAGCRPLDHSSVPRVRHTSFASKSNPVVACWSVNAAQHILCSTRWHYAGNDHWRQRYSESATTPIAQPTGLNQQASASRAELWGVNPWSKDCWVLGCLSRSHSHLRPYH